MKGAVRCAIVGLAICSWLAISNHCTFAALAAKTVPTPSECPFHSKPEKPKQPPAGTQCCKILRALVFAAAKGWTRDDSKFSGVDLRFEQLIIVCASYSAPPLLLDTGPPGKTFFVELICSSPRRAPPSLA